MRYSVKAGESPAIIARRFGLPMSKLIGANPHKPATVVAGVRTWRSLHANEVVSIPVSGTVGDFLGVAPAPRSGAHPLLKRFAGSDPSQVALAQTLLGISADGVFGQGTEAAVKAFQARNGLYADGIVGPNTWAKLLGAPAPAPSSAPSSAPSATPAPASGAPSSSLAAAAARAAAALSADPGYCSSVRRSGTAVNSAIHGFKAAWNAANPRSPVPINTGNYEPSVAAALSSALGGAPVPPGCGATAAAPASAPAPSAPSGQIPTSIPTVTPATAPAAAQALSSVDPCYSGNVSMVCAAQAALGITPHGKYGPGTAAALRRFLPSAPAPCSPTPLWWGHKTDNKCTGGASPVSAPQAAAQAAQAANQAAQAAQAQAAQSPQAAAAAQVATQAAQAATQAAQAAQAAPSDQAAAQAAQTAAQAAQTAQQAAQAAGAPAPSPGGPTQPLVTTPGEKKGLSTGAMVAGALGAAALVGVVAVAASGKKKHGGARKRSGAKRKAGKKRRK